MAWDVRLTTKARKNLQRLPARLKKIFQALLAEMEIYPYNDTFTILKLSFDKYGIYQVIEQCFEKNEINLRINQTRFENILDGIIFMSIPAHPFRVFLILRILTERVQWV